VRDDDADARHAAVYGLVGEGTGTEFLNWLLAADLPDPAAVLADPAGVNWKDRPDRVWAILAGVVAHFDLRRWDCRPARQRRTVMHDQGV
jgi:hypothetical protein